MPNEDNDKWYISGPLGIGTTPDHPLHVADSEGHTNLRFGDEADLSVLRVENAKPNSTTVLHFANDKQGWQFRVDGSDGHKLKVFDANAVRYALTIDTSGNVGIGTAEPSESLQIDGSIYVQGEGRGLIVDEVNGGKRVGFLKYNGREAGIWRVANQDFEIGRRLDVSKLPGSAVPDSVSMVTDLYIAGNGNVGIGTATPSDKLEISGNVTVKSPDANIYSLSFIRTDESGREHKWALWHMNKDHRKNALEIWEYKTDSSVKTCGGDTTDGAMCDPRLVILEGGNVGIGTSSPETTLHVGGDLMVAGRINCRQWRITSLLAQEKGPLSRDHLGGGVLGGSINSSGGTLLILATGSGFSTTASKQIGMYVEVDRKVVGQAKIWANEAGSHKSFVGTPIVVKSIGAGNHTVRISPINSDTLTDHNDYFDLTVIELPFI